MTRKRKGTDWQMQPKVNQTPDAQGTLFHGGPNRWPRGFTPERGQEVTQAIHVVGAAPLRDPQKPFDPVEFGQQRVSRQRVIDTVARSTMPMTDLGGEKTNIYSVSPQLAPYRKDLAGAAGVYLGDRYGPGHEIMVRQESQESGTVLHELGHVVSSVRGNPHAAYTTPTLRGQEEAFADDYAVTHFRDRRGRPAERGVYRPSDNLAATPEAKASFGEAYRASRKTSIGRNWGDGSILTELQKDEDDFREANPPLPGMEGMRRRHSFSEAPAPHYEMPYQYERRRRSEAGRQRAVGI